MEIRVWSCGICGGQSGSGAGFLRVLRFPLPICIPPTAPQSPSSIIWGWYNRKVVAAVPSGLSLTPLRIIKKSSGDGRSLFQETNLDGITVFFFAFPSSGILETRKHRTMEKSKKPSNPVCYTPSSEPFGIYLIWRD
jgi:hypothetical protein